MAPATWFALGFALGAPVGVLVYELGRWHERRAYERRRRAP